ncbi:GNAT family N-acetyltransferase [Ochrobactrum teleogrylli]|uniref:GNAT family N-acetyltransferase n=1 Tax=Ochrobactrum teleogrylli TaxID=2479765 RepID=A0ABY2Y6H6_9HYPH|nr:GNAT family N-acetyltransferase [[Ochrobactrum] teleogrylli]TNV17148.1 GNAT family N-acetyltransferase [[Ochrobactrum] teleogrylli]
MTTPRIVPITQDFARWDELLKLIRDSFAYMDGVIDPPSSAHLLTAEGLKQKASDEIGFVALIGEELVGCVFIKEGSDSFYLGKLAVAPAFEGQGIARALMHCVEAETIAKGKPAIELQVRIELMRNRAVFEKLGYRKIAETAHPGYTRTTSVTMRKEIA